MATLTTHRFTVSDFEQMIKSGVLTKEHRVELLDGEIVDMAPIGPEHNGGVDYLNAHFKGISLDDAIVRVQGSIRLDENSRPQPDLALLRPRKDFYRSNLPTPKDVLLLIEVADSTRLDDHRRKIPLYAKAAIREVWLVDLADEILFVHRDLRSGIYRTMTQHLRGDRVAPLAFPRHFLNVGELFG